MSHDKNVASVTRDLARVSVGLDELAQLPESPVMSDAQRRREIDALFDHTIYDTSSAEGESREEAEQQQEIPPPRRPAAILTPAGTAASSKAKGKPQAKAKAGSKSTTASKVPQPATTVAAAKTSGPASTSNAGRREPLVNSGEQTQYWKHLMPEQSAIQQCLATVRVVRPDLADALSIILDETLLVQESAFVDLFTRVEGHEPTEDEWKASWEAALQDVNAAADSTDGAVAQTASLLATLFNSVRAQSEFK